MSSPVQNEAIALQRFFLGRRDLAGHRNGRHQLRRPACFNGFRHALSHAVPGTLPNSARLRATAGTRCAPRRPVSGPALGSCCQVRASGGLQAWPPDKRERIISGRPASPAARPGRGQAPSPSSPATTRLQRSSIFAPAADEVALHAVDPVQCGELMRSSALRRL